MIKLFLYIGILIILCYILDYFWIKTKKNIKEIKEAYKDLKDAEDNLHNSFKDKGL
jgi:hypothetical protein